MKTDSLLTNRHSDLHSAYPGARSVVLRQATMVALVSLAAMSSSLLAQTTPSQSPLLTGSSGARPNVMLGLDNSGSMGWSFHETYGILTDTDDSKEVFNCSSYGNGYLGQPRPSNDATLSRICLNTAVRPFEWRTGTSFSTPRYVTGGRAAQRSAQVNPIYYDPRITYAPRVTANGLPIAANTWLHISNQNSTYSRFESTSATTWWHSTLDQTISPRPVATPPYWLYNSFRIPAHVVHTATTIATAPDFEYANCTNVLTNPQNNLQDGCGAWTYTKVSATNAAQVISLPSDHKRTDCNVSGDRNRCTNEQERRNIVNWYRWYVTRMEAVKTALGQALANDAYQKEIRVGYLPINGTSGAEISLQPGVDTGVEGTLRGVRLLDKSLTTANNTNQRLYDWLYALVPNGGTPLHNTVKRVADYYRVPSGAQENPWATNPAALASTSNPEMTCRRSFHVLFSDGAWSVNTSNIAGQDFDNTVPTSPFTRQLPDGTTESFRYSPSGVAGEGRRLYTPYPGPATGGLADLTAQYYWHRDLRDQLNNEVQTRPGQPTFWQNMTTYTVGYLVRPSGQFPGAPATSCANYSTSPLTFKAIECYQAAYAASGTNPPAQPRWATGELNGSTVTAQQRIDDFIQAGYTGGGRSFSVSTAEEVRSAFNVILSDILNSSGRDAGVAVGSSGTDNASIAGNLKYNVSYRTLDNSGDVTAQELDATGNIVRTVWEASKTIPTPSSRRVFSMSGQNTPVAFDGDFSALPLDIRDALRAGPEPTRIPNDARFVNYLRGLDPVTDAQGRLFRQRSGKMGAMVNPPSIYMGADTDFAYDRVSDTSAIAGSGSYETYVRNKMALPASLFVATNAGQVHSFNANTGAELAVFMPRRSLKRMLSYARDDYAFEYVLDGPLSEHDIYDGTRWNHVAMGTGGRGERLIYALRSPLNTTAVPVNREPGRLDFLWETGPEAINSTDFSMGYITNPARSGQTRNGDWVVLVNSGHYNGQADGSRHGLIVLDARNGNVLKRIPLPSGYSAGRGLSGITVVRDSNKRIVAAYAGDANGNLWRFDLKGSRSEWGVSYNKPLFTEPNNRPIYGAPAWQASRRHKDGAVVVIATGILLDDNDPADVSRAESIYGIWDPTPIGGNDVNSFATRQASNLLLQNVTASDGVAGVAGNEFFKTSEQRYDPKVHMGWRLPLNRETGERSIDQIRNLGSNVLIATTVVQPPADPTAEMCRVSDLPTNYLYVLDAQTGAMPKRALDQDGDGKLDAYSVVRVRGGGFSRGMAVRETFKGDLWSGDLRKRRNTQADEGEGSTETKCLSTTARLIGTEGGSIAAGSSCTSGWNRSQYQLVQPPA